MKVKPKPRKSRKPDLNIKRVEVSESDIHPTWHKIVYGGQQIEWGKK